MRLLIFGDSAGTGFGTVTRELGRAFLARGLDVRFVSLNEQPNGEQDEPFKGRTLSFGSREGWLRGVSRAEYERLSGLLGSGVELLPADRATLEEIRQVSERMARVFTDGEAGWVPDAALIIGDVGSLQLSHVEEFLPDGFPAWHYVPIEGDMLPPAWARHWRKLAPVAMTEFGAAEIEKITGSRPPAIYHGVDTETFYPVSALRPIMIAGRRQIGPNAVINTKIPLNSRRECKEYVANVAEHLTEGRVKLDPARLWIMRADRLVPRKQYQSLLRSLAVVLARHPDAEFIYHCRGTDEGGNIRDMISHFHPAIAARMNPTGWHDAPDMMGATRAALAAIYNAADIYVSSGSEGFGLTIAEAMACGVPAVGLDYSAVSEVIGDAGKLVPVGGYFDNIYAHRWARPDERAFADAVSALISAPGARRDLGRRATERIRRLCNWDTAAGQFAALFAARVGEAVAA